MTSSEFIRTELDVASFACLFYFCLSFLFSFSYTQNKLAEVCLTLCEKLFIMVALILIVPCGGFCVAEFR